MKINEFITLYNENKESAFANLKVINKLPSLYKIAFINDITDSLVKYNENGIAMTDKLMNEILFNINVLGRYADLEFTSLTENDVNTIFGEYDSLEELGLVEEIIASINPKEYVYLKNAYEDKITYEVKLANSVEGMINNKLNILMDKITKALESFQENINPETIQVIIDKVKEIKPENLELLSKVVDFNNGKNTQKPKRVK